MLRWDAIVSALGFKVGFGSSERTIVDENGSLTPKDIVVIETREGAGSYQSIAADLTLDAAAGTSVSDDSDFLAAGMFNVFGENLTKEHNYVAGVIGAYSVTGTNASTYPTGGVMGVVSDGTTSADGAVVAVLDGAAQQTIADAAFKAMANNFAAGSGFRYGVDLYDPARDGYNALAILNALLRSPNEVCYLEGDGAPTDGGSGTGAGYAGKGSHYTDYTNAELYINAGSKASPTWKKVTRAA